MKAPEKIHTSLVSDRIRKTKSNSDEYDEYIRTDAFIKKACEFIRKGGKKVDAYIVTEFGEEVFDFLQFSDDFKEYMKGE